MPGRTGGGRAPVAPAWLWPAAGVAQGDLVFVTTQGSSTNEEWSYVYNPTVSGTTLSDYAINPTTEAISSTPTSSITISALSGATNIDSGQDTVHGILFLMIQGATPSVVPVPYNVTTGAFGTPAPAATFGGNTIYSACSNSSNTDAANHLLFLNNATSGGFGIYGYNATTGAIGAATMPFTALTIPGRCTAIDSSNRLLFFVNNSTSSVPYSPTSVAYPASGASVTQVNSVSGSGLGTLQERAATNRPD